MAGGFDSLIGTTQAHYFHNLGNGITYYEKAIRYGANVMQQLPENDGIVVLDNQIQDFDTVFRNLFLEKR